MVTRDPAFRTDLYRGTAAYYDRYRPSYPETLFDDLCRRLPISGNGRLLDLACGTGQIAFPLAKRFVEVLAVDQEEESVAYGRAKADATGVGNIHWATGSAEIVDIDGPFELIAIGNAFHRLNRALVARRTWAWLERGGGVALLWSDMPWQGDLPWQQGLEKLVVEWMEKTGAIDRIPAGWGLAQRLNPHDEVLREAGFEYLGRFEFTQKRIWTIETLIGYSYSTSILNRDALVGRAEDFERDLTERLSVHARDDGTLRQEASYAYELACVPRSTSV